MDNSIPYVNAFRAQLNDLIKKPSSTEENRVFAREFLEMEDDPELGRLFLLAAALKTIAGGGALAACDLVCKIVSYKKIGVVRVGVAV